MLNLDSNLIQKYTDGLKNQKLSVTIHDDLSVDQLIKFKENEDNFELEIAPKVIKIILINPLPLM